MLSTFIALVHKFESMCSILLCHFYMSMPKKSENALFDKTSLWNMQEDNHEVPSTKKKKTKWCKMILPCMTNILCQMPQSEISCLKWWKL